MAPDFGIKIEGVSHAYGGGQSGLAAGTLALKQTDLLIRHHEFHALLGPSGCGKSTLLYLIGGFIPVQTGTISTQKGPVTAPGPDRSIVFQNFALFPWKTVLENVMYGLQKKGLPEAECRDIAQAHIKLVQLGGFEQAYPSQLSGGMQQRAAIARTLAVDPDILLMDEPFGALDAQTRRVMQEELRMIWKKRPKTVVFVTHSVGEAVFLAALGRGLDDDPVAAFASVLADIVTQTGCAKPLRFAAVQSDGNGVWAYRWASDGHPPTLYWRRLGDGVVVASEPFDAMPDAWTEVPCGSALHIGREGVVRVAGFAPAQATARAA